MDNTTPTPPTEVSVMAGGRVKPGQQCWVIRDSRVAPVDVERIVTQPSHYGIGQYLIVSGFNTYTPFEVYASLPTAAAELVASLERGEEYHRRKLDEMRQAKQAARDLLRMIGTYPEPATLTAPSLEDACAT